MRVNLIETDKQIEYQVEDVPRVYREGLNHYFFSEKDGCYSKTYDKATFMFPHNIHLLKHNFEDNLETMLNTTLGNIDMDWERALKDMIGILEKHHIDWWLAGSAACAVRGINITPGDIDIMTYKTEIRKIEQAFKDYIVEPFHHVTDWMVKGFGIIFINGRIDVAFEPEKSSDDYGKLDCGFYAMHHLETINWKGHTIKVPPVELHMASNQGRNRTNRVRLIRQYIKDKGGLINEGDSNR